MTSRRMTSRRNHHDLHSPAEAAITAAMDQIERMGADERLTDAVCRLGDVRDLVSDYVDERLARFLEGP